ncbi:unnamed protein product [Rotaria magnacalcarata]|uniref:Cytochrome P450 n=2 Tax=Rotaria magnacalcarata TaxID=392030 RepID=A0A816W965_9BILA|nr:unnamed protein product [Rotaria magnacalcarata]
MVLLLIFGLFSVVVILALFIYIKLIRPAKQLYDAFRAQGFPGEPFVPLIGQMKDYQQAEKSSDVLSYFNELCKKHGHCFLFSYGPFTRFFCSEPEIIAEVLGRTKAQNFRKPTNFIGILKPIIGHQNVLLLEGSEHDRARKMLNPAFHFVKLQSMIPIMTRETENAIDALLEESHTKTIDLKLEFKSMTLSIIAASAFGQSFEEIPDAKKIVSNAFNEVLDAINYRTVRMINLIPLVNKLPFWRKQIVDEGAKRVNDFVDRVIANRRQGKSESLSSNIDLLDLLLSASDDDGQGLSNNEIKDEALTFILAGHETTASLMVWTIYVLMTNEHVLEACRKEVDCVLSDGRKLTAENINELNVIGAVLNETLRLYPPAPYITRECANEHIIGQGSQNEVRMPKGCTVVINAAVLHRRPDLWPRPDEFDYNRWIRDPVTGLKPKLSHPYAYLPFAAGPKNCIGQNFALLEAKVILALLVQRCNFELVPGQKVIPEIAITMRPKYGLFARVSSRR